MAKVYSSKPRKEKKLDKQMRLCYISLKYALDQTMQEIAKDKFLK